MRIVGEIEEVREAVAQARAKGGSIGFFPTLGGLHEGHLSLIRRARADNDFVVASVFVNPTQFGPDEDLEAYPRQLEADAAMVEECGGDLVFAPSEAEMYPADASTYVEVEGLTEVLCGAYRPGHFRGVTTVVAKLLNIVCPDRAYFGEKDFQQLAIIRRMVRDLNMPVEIVGCSTVREADGLAMSSRNSYLTLEQRQAAPAIHQALTLGAEAVRNGCAPAEAERIVRDHIENTSALRVQYARALDPETLAEPDYTGPPILLAAAVFAGDTRLIDNIVVKE